MRWLGNHHLTDRKGSSLLRLPIHPDSRSRADERQNACHGARRYSYAALGGRETGLGNMKENRTAAIADCRPHVPVRHHADIVETILARHAFMAGPIGQSDRAIVIAIAWRVAPAISVFDLTQRKTAPGRARRGSVTTKIAGQEPQISDWSCAVPFALEHRRTCTPQRAWKDEWPHNHQSLGRSARPAAHLDQINRFAGFTRHLEDNPRLSLR